MNPQPDTLTAANLLGDARILWQLLRGQPARHRDGDPSNAAAHAATLQNFYAPQAERYDAFRERLLHGRRELIERLAISPGSTVIDMGGGTGRNLDYIGARMLSLARVEVVDLCPALLDQARRRCAQWPDVAVAVEADATTYRPQAGANRAPSQVRGHVDCVIFSYSLTMIPDWRRAINNALRILRPGGLIGVVDFRVSRRDPPPGYSRHGALTRRFWPRWFGHDGVHLDAEHLHTLAARTEPVVCEERMAAVPYLPGLRAPYYLYIGRKAGRDAAPHSAQESAV
jgi:S-adenosylmethionine-diacylgycerolhomoserine-N-methlytransferase